MISDSTTSRATKPRKGWPGRLTPVALSIALGAALTVGPTWPAASPVSAFDNGNGAADPDATSIMYQQALEHANDPNTFVPGDAVTVPYHPRAGDTTLVDGRLPIALPAGTASGRSMAASPQGSIWATPDVVSPSATPTLSESTPSPTAQPQAAPAANVLRREVLGFLPYWESVAGPTLNYDILSTVAYFGVGVDGHGNLQKSDSSGTTIGWAGWTSSWMTNVINAAHAHGTRVVLTVEEFAWTTSELNEQADLLASAANRLNAAQQIAAAVSQRGADGVDLDFEPIASTQEGNYTSFVRTLRAQLDAINPGYELTFCATGSTGYYDVAGLTASGAADAVFIMGYDFRTGSSSYAGSIDPLTSPKPVYDLTQVVNLWKARTSVSKIILGLPYYGIAWSTTSNAPNATVISGSACSPVSVFFAQAASLAATNGRNYDSIEQSAWTSYQLTCGGVATWRELYYDDAQSLGAKYDMINYWNLRGMGIWALGYDAGHPEMAALVANKFLTDRTPPKVGIVDLPASESSEGFPVSWTGQDDWNGIASYDVQVSTDGGPFTDWLTGTTETSDDFQGSSGHNYSFRVRATDGVGNVSAWDVTSTYTASPAFAVGAFATVTAASVSERATASPSATVVTTATRGTVLQIIGGPATASDGSIWYQVTGPFATVNAVVPLFPGPWVEVSSGSTNYVVPITPPNSTAVSAGISDYSVGVPGMLPSGTGIDRGKVFSPDGDGIHDTLPVSWNDTKAFDDVTLTIYREDETVAGTIDLGALGAGPQSYTWDGTLDGTSPLPDGTYMIQVAGTADSTTYYAPSAAPFGTWQIDQLGVVIDTTPSGTYYPLAPVRVLDTRYGFGLTGPFKEGQVRSLKIAGAVGGVPAGAIAVTGNLTVTRATAAGYVRFGSSVSGTASTINFKAGDNRANGVTLGLAANGSLSGVYYASSAKDTVQLIFDITGYFMRDPGGATFIPVTPTRIVDSRIKKGISTALSAYKVATFGVVGLAGVPSNAIAVTGNATVTGQTGAGYVTVAPTIATRGQPGSSTLNFPLGDARANNVTVPLSGGKLQVEYVGKAKTTAQFIFDVTGYFVPGLSGATFVPLAPGRVVDSRSALGFKGPLKSGATASFAVSGQVSVHPIAVAVVGNLTVTAQTAAGWLAAAPGPVTATSTVNFPVGDNRANGFVSLLGPNGTLSVTYGSVRGATTQVVVDILGYYR
ncbi:MAG: glycosyl hydrolase family 18 protein [Candidatus Limnocylindrales bacterium]|jgi:spore germination protein YaaH